MKMIQVTLIGGPADLQRHTIDDRLRRYQVAVVDQIHSTLYDAPFAQYTAEVHTHTYEIRQVDHKVFVGIWQQRWR